MSASSCKSLPPSSGGVWANECYDKWESSLSLWVGMLPPAQKGQSMTIPRASPTSGEEWRLKISPWRAHGRGAGQIQADRAIWRPELRAKVVGDLCCAWEVSGEGTGKTNSAVSTCLPPHTLSWFHLHIFTSSPAQCQNPLVPLRAPERRLLAVRFQIGHPKACNLVMPQFAFSTTFLHWLAPHICGDESGHYQ